MDQMKLAHLWKAANGKNRHSASTAPDIECICAQWTLLGVSRKTLLSFGSYKTETGTT